MATINTASPFVNGQPLIAGDWNTKYDLLYNQINGFLDNTNVATTAGVLESKVLFADTGHDHSGSKAIDIAASINTSSCNKGDILVFDGSKWATFGSGAQGTSLSVSYDAYTALMAHFEGASGDTAFTDSVGKAITNPVNSYDSFTKLLAHFDGTSGTTSFVLTTGQTTTAYGTAAITTAQHYFGSGSLYLDGNSDTISIPDADELNFGAGDWTVDFWVRFSSLPGWGDMICQRSIGGAQFKLSYDGSNNRIDLNIDNDSNGRVWCAFTPTTDTWYHLAVVRSGNTPYIFINGVSQPVTIYAAFGTFKDGTDPIYIGSRRKTDEWFPGYIDELRISKGIARWTANFPVPILPYDVAYKDTAQYKIGSSSARFNDGTYLTTPDHADWFFGTGDFTIDFWSRFVSLPTSGDSMTLVTQYVDTSNAWRVYTTNSSGTYKVCCDVTTGGVNKITVQKSASIDTATWYHLAVVRSSDIFTIYQNGASIGTTNDTDTVPNYAGSLYIGQRGNGTQYMNGWLDELRISKGIARWATAFTPPTDFYQTGLIWR